jgi:flagellar hook assembly protein FlgD
VNGEITFVYGGIPNKGTLNLTIYDLAGIRVLKKTLDTSSSEYVWNCKNGAGKKIKTGVYIYILEYKGTDKSYKLVDKFAIVR